MKRLKSLIGVALFAGGLLAAMAVPPPQDGTNSPPARPAPVPRGIRAGSSIDQLARTLKLDDAATAKVKAILDAQQQKVNELRADTSLSDADRRARFQALREDTSKQMQAILTPAQYTQWEQLSQPRERRMAPPTQK